MKITITNANGADLPINEVSMRRLPHGWSGDVPDDKGAALIEAGHAKLVDEPPAPAPDFTDDERAVLKAAAADVLAHKPADGDAAPDAADTPARKRRATKAQA
jgi:hypothetical protein